MVMGQQYSLGRRGLSDSPSSHVHRPYMAEDGTRDSNLRMRSWCCAPLHGTPSPPWKPLSTVMLSQALALQC